LNVVLFSSDLMVQSRVAGAAQRMGAALTQVGTTGELRSATESGQAAVVIVDLSMPSVMPNTIVEACDSSRGGRPTIVAFGPHVHESLLAAARAAGCDQVISRGQFFAQLEAILRGATADQSGEAGGGLG
jgi:DNA-binding NarL/FixJ family response regulator